MGIMHVFQANGRFNTVDMPITHSEVFQHMLETYQLAYPVRRGSGSKDRINNFFGSEGKYIPPYERSHYMADDWFFHAETVPTKDDRTSLVALQVYQHYCMTGEGVFDHSLFADVARLGYYFNPEHVEADFRSGAFAAALNARYSRMNGTMVADMGLDVFDLGFAQDLVRQDYRELACRVQAALQEKGPQQDLRN